MHTWLSMQRLHAMVANPSRMATLVVLLGFHAGCERQAPSPEECLAAARRWQGIAPGVELARLPPSRRQGTQKMTLDCITQPFPTEFVHCVGERGQSSVCNVFMRK